MRVAPSSVLYYPSIDIKNEQWLRNAILFWDTIKTIVPESIQDPYKSNLSRELNENGILLPITISSNADEVSEVADIANKYLKDEYYSKFVFVDDKNESGIDPDKKRFYSLIHADKLWAFFPGFWDDRDSGWIKVHPEFARFYLTLLASRIAAAKGLGLVTESSIADEIALSIRGNGSKGIFTSPPSELSRRKRFVPAEISSGMLIDLVVDTISVPPNIPVKEIIKFRNEHSEELGLFRQEVCKLVTGLSEEVSIEALRQQVSDVYKANIRPALSSLKKSLALRAWDTGLQGFLKTSCFSVPPTALAVHAGVSSQVALLAAVGISLVASKVQLRRYRHEMLSNNPYAYLLSLESMSSSRKRSNPPFSLSE